MESREEEPLDVISSPTGGECPRNSSYDVLEGGVTKEFTCVIHPLSQEGIIIVVAEGWPCWLPAVLSLRLPLQAVFAPRYSEQCFAPSLPQGVRWQPLREWKSLPIFPPIWRKACVLASGSVEFCKSVLATLGEEHVGPFIFTIDIKFKRISTRSLQGICTNERSRLLRLRLCSLVLEHASFGGVTSARHPVAFRNVHPEVFTPFFQLPRTLSHIINPAAKVPTTQVDPPNPLSMRERAPLWDGGALRGEGLYDVCAESPEVVCRCVFNTSRWAKRHLTPTEILKAFDVPAFLTNPLSIPEMKFHRELLQRSVSSGVLTSILRALWDDCHQEVGGKGISRGSCNQKCMPQSKGDGGVESVEEENKVLRKCKNSHDKLTKVHGGAERQVVVDSRGGRSSGYYHDYLTKSLPDLKPTGSEVAVDSSSVDGSLAATLKREHDIAKAVKNDDAEVPVEIWNQAVCRGEVSDQQARALDILRVFMLRIYRRRLRKEVCQYLSSKLGRGWVSKKGTGSDEVRAMREIMWRASENDWFDYSAGSRLMYFRFPARYQRQALEGVPVRFNMAGPSSRSVQPWLRPEEREVLRSKIVKILHKRYLVPIESEGCLSSIKYFAVPKGDADWRVVFHAGANGLTIVSTCLPFSCPR